VLLPLLLLIMLPLTILADAQTFFTPWVTFNKATGLFVLWFNAYLQGCCNGNW
jgi:hypothetical protein